MKLIQTAIAGLTGALFVVAAHATDITGAGSTFAAPIYAKWADAFQKANGGKVNYQGIGSSGGIKQIIAKTVDFAGSDAPLGRRTGERRLVPVPNRGGRRGARSKSSWHQAGRVDSIWRSARRHVPRQNQKVE